MNKYNGALLALLTSAILAACGGGSDNSNASANSDPADKYVGSWTTNCFPFGGQSDDGVVTYTKINATTLSSSLITRTYSNTSCTGEFSTSPEPAGMLTVDGTASASGRTVDKVTDSTFGGTFKELYYVEGNQLFGALKGSPKDDQGYPTQLNLTQVGVHR